MEWVLFLILPASIHCFLIKDWESVHLYVSPHGSDHNTGRELSHPLKTISKALSHLDDHDIHGKNVFVELMEGYYDLSHTLYITHDAARRVTIRAYNQQEVHVTGGKRIPSNAFKVVTDSHILQRIPGIAHGKVQQTRLSDVGISDLGHLAPYGFYIDRAAPLEIFFNGSPLRLARWPNQGQGYVGIASLVDGQHGVKFKYAGTRPNRWTAESDIWAHGFWYWSWADRSVKIKSIDTQSKTITLADRPQFGLRTGNFSLGHNRHLGYSHQGGYYRVINALSELDEPGEYYIDRTSGILYIWAPNPSGTISSNDIIYGSMIPICVQASNAANLVFEGFTIEACRHYGVLLRSATNVTFQEMEMKNTGSYGIKCQNCRSTTVTRTEMHDGDGGIDISGGDRATLTPSGNSIDNNHIWSYSRETAVGANAIALQGVGTHVNHNELHLGQYTAIRWSGNDHIIEYNHVHHNCMNASDCGAVHTGRDWTGRGNIIRHNHIHHTLRFYPGADVRGIMLDDQYSSVLIENNVFYDNDVHVNIGGGRDNIVRRNIFYNATFYTMQMDSRGTKHTNDQTLYRILHSLPYKNALWTRRYPKLAVIDSQSPGEPRGNQIYENVFYNDGTEDFKGDTNRPKWFNITHNRQAFEKSDFNSPETADFRPRCSLSNFVNKVHFETPVSLSAVGPQHPVGPAYKNRGIHSPKPPSTTENTSPCTTKAPAKTVPQGSYLPDGSRPNTIYQVSNQGCWFHVDKCPNHPSFAGNSHDQNSYLHRDVDGESKLHTGSNETACLSRVPYMVQYCGTHSEFSVIYGPTGAMTLGGDGCFFAQYPCVKHGILHTGFIRDRYAEQHDHADHNEQKCLSRAVAQWRYCGSDPAAPITSIYRPTGHISTAGAGCWLRVSKCPADSNMQTGLFYDAWGAANSHSGLYVRSTAKVIYGREKLRKKEKPGLYVRSTAKVRKQERKGIKKWGGGNFDPNNATDGQLPGIFIVHRGYVVGWMFRKSKGHLESMWQPCPVSCNGLLSS